MIPENFYEVAGTYKCGNTVDQFTDSYTVSARDIANFMTDRVSAYWLGYISTENLPMAFRFSISSYSQEEGFIFRDTTSEANFPCGYCTGNRMPGTSFYGMPQYEVNTVYINDYSFTNWQYNNISLFNSLHPEYSGYANYGNNNKPSFDLKCYIFDAGENFIQQYDYGMIFSSYRRLYNFFNGEETFRANIANHIVEISKEDLETGTCYKKAEDDYYIRMFLTNYRFNLGQVKNGTYGQPTVLPAFMVETTFTDSQGDEGKCLVFGNQGVAVGNGLVARVLNGQVQWALNWWAQYGGGARAGLDGQITQEAYLALRNSPYTRWYVYNNNVLLTKDSNDYYFYCIFPIDEVRKHFSLMYRVDITDGANTPSYVLGLTYATNVSETNEFLASLKTGNITNQAFKDSLRPWQYSDIAVNEFTEDDVPPYEPTPPSPGNEDEEYGDSIDNQYRYYGASKFITQYALTRSQLELFGEKLWTSWADTLGNPTEMWKNFKMFLGGGGDTGSIDISTALDFIISLRVFPYDLTDSLMLDVNGIRLGRGEYPIDVGIVKKMISLVQYVDFGSITVPRPFGDYRDYENMNISLVLPYCGTTQLNPGDVIGRTLTCTYAVDMQSGTCTAFVWVSASTDKGEHHYNVAEMSGQIGTLLPVSATNSGQIMSQRISDAASVATTIVSPIDSLPSTIMGAANGNMGGAALHKAANIAPILGALNPELYSGISDVASALSRPAISCPSLGGGSGIAAFHQPASPYIQLRYGMYTEPANYKHSTGYPSTKSTTLSNYSGYVVCSNVDVSSLTCHTDEKAAIKAALESGVYV